PGQTMSGPVFVLEPGYCYTFLGQSLPPVVDMEMALQLDATGAAGAFLPPTMTGLANMAQTTLLVSTVPGERTGMSQGKSCYMGGLPGAGRVVLRGGKGGGPGAGRGFRKKTF